MAEFLGNLATTVIGILGSLFIAYRIYERTTKDEASRLEKVLGNDRRIREEQSAREARVRKTEGLLAVLSDASHELGTLVSALRAEKWTTVRAQALAIHEAARPLGKYVGLNILSEWEGPGGPPDGQQKAPHPQGIRDTLGFAVSDARVFFLAAVAIGELIAEDQGKDHELLSDGTSFTAVLWVSLFGMAKKIQHWEATGEFRNGAFWPKGEYVDRVFERVGIPPSSVGRSDDS